ncbi:MAG: chorismate synthase [Elusimicrobiota bacterium]
MLEYLTCGGSHSPKIAGIISGLPSGLHVEPYFISSQLARRRTAPGRGKRQMLEKEDFEIISGVDKNFVTDGSPVGIIMSNASRLIPEDNIVRPSHADMPGFVKYGIKPWLARERASARETAVRTALFCFTMRFVNELGIKIKSRVLSIAGQKSAKVNSLKDFFRKIEKKGLSAGGIFELRASNLPVGIGSYARAEERLSYLLFSVLGSLNAVKGVEIGDGFSFDRAGGACDEFTEKNGFWKISGNRCGGINAGVSNGQDIVLRCAVKPLSGSPEGERSFNYLSAKSEKSFSLTSDISAVYPAAVVGEFLLSYVLAKAFLAKFGGDSMTEIKARVCSWRKISCSKMKAR